MQILKRIGAPGGCGRVCRPQRGHIRIAFAADQFREYWCARKPSASLEAQNEIASGSRGPAVTVDERMDRVQAPQYKRRKHHGVSILPQPIHLIDEVVHQRLDLIVLWRSVLTYGYRARTIPARIRVQTRDSLIIQRFKDV